MDNQITKIEAREALVDYVSENPCWGSKPALKMEIDQIVTTPVYRYQLYSFIEKRLIFLESKPYEGGKVDGPRSGPAVQAWDIGATPKHMLGVVWQEQQFVIPHTSSIRTCSECRSIKKCTGCRGKGSKRC